GDHGGKRHAVAAELQHFLQHHRLELPPEAVGAENLHEGHWKLSFDFFIRSMNTSSSEGYECSHFSFLSARKGLIAASSLALSRPETCRLVPNGATMSMPGFFSSSVCSCAR